MPSPFKFLAAYTQDDRASFFGRDGEIELLYDKVFESKLVLVYGASGTGKTSLVQCGLSKKFADTDWLPLVLRREGDFEASLWRAVREAARTPINDDQSITAALRSLYLDHYKPVFLIFDQFEELFTLGEWGGAENGQRNEGEALAFFELLDEILASTVDCRCLLVFREEYIAYLSDYEHVMPTLFDHRQRVEWMTRMRLTEVIEGTTRVHGISLTPPETAEMILDQLVPKASGQRLALTHLQVYLDQLYDRAEAAQEEGQPVTFTPELVARTGALENVLADFTNEQIAELDQITEVPGSGLELFFAFVTDQGTKRSLLRADLSKHLPQISESKLDACVERLLAARLLVLLERNTKADEHPVQYLELAHDSLAAVIYDQVSIEKKAIRKVEQFLLRRENDHQIGGGLLSKKDLDYIEGYWELLERDLPPPVRAFAEKSRASLKQKRKLRLGAIGVFLLLLISGGVTLSGWMTSNRIKGSLDKVLQAQLLEAEDPTAAFALAQEAWALDENAVVEQTMYQLYRDHVFYRTLLTDSVQYAALSPFGHTVAYSRPEDFSLYRHSLTQASTKPLKGHKYNVGPMAFSPNSSELLSGGADKQLVLWGSEGDSLGVLAGFQRNVVAVCWSSDAKLVGGGDLAGEVKIWNKSTRSPVWSHTFSQAITSLVFVPDTQQLLIASGRRVYLRDFEQDSLWTVLVNDAPITSISYAPKGDKWLIISENRVLVCRNDQATDTLQLTANCTAAQFCSDGRIATATDNGEAQIWRADGTLLRTLKTGNRDAIHSLAITHDDSLLMTAGEDGTIRLWAIPYDVPVLTDTMGFAVDGLYNCGYIPSKISKIKKDALVKGTTILAYKKTKNISALSPTIWIRDAGRHTSIAHGNEEGATYFVEVINGGGGRRAITQHTDAVTAVAFSPDGNYLVSGGIDKQVLLQPFLPERTIDSLGSHDLRVRALAWSFDSKRILSGGNEGKVKLWRISGDHLGTYDIHNKEGVMALAFSLDGERYAVGTDGNQVYLGEVGEAPSLTLTGHEGFVNLLRFTPDGQRLLSAGADGFLMVWDLQGHLLRRYEAGSSILSLIIRRDTIYTGLENGVVARWRDDKKALKE